LHALTSEWWTLIDWLCAAGRSRSREAERHQWKTTASLVRDDEYNTSMRKSLDDMIMAVVDDDEFMMTEVDHD